MAKRNYKRKSSNAPSSFYRKSGRGSKPGSALLIVTEGENTEPAYFEEIRKVFASNTIELVSHGAGRGDPKKLAEKAIELQRNEGVRPGTRNSVSAS